MAFSKARRLSDFIAADGTIPTGKFASGTMTGALTATEVNIGAGAHPSIEDQLDKIYHEGIDAWKADIQAIKNANPKENN